MGRKRMSGLVNRDGNWHIDKKVDGVRICESTGTSRLEEAEKYLTRRLESIRQAKVYGIRPKRLFRQAATKFLLENEHKRSIKSDVDGLKMLDGYIGNLALESVHMGTLQTYITTRQKEGVKNRTVNYGLQIIRHILNLAASEWMDEYGLTWLGSAPKIKLLPQNDARKPYPLDWEEQDRLFAALPLHLQEMALFAVNTGCRDGEICKLRWEWEIQVPIAEIGSVFIIPGERVKNGEERLVVLNRIARAVIERQRGKHPEYVFVYHGKPIHHMLNNGWRKARKLTGIPARVHDLKHTFGRRLRSAGVSFEDRQDLLGHKSSRITTHYSSAELLNLWEASNKVCTAQNRPVLTLLKTVSQQSHAKITQGVFGKFTETRVSV
jgi:integrase